MNLNVKDVAIQVAITVAVVLITLKVKEQLGKAKLTAPKSDA